MWAGFWLVLVDIRIIAIQMLRGAGIILCMSSHYDALFMGYATITVIGQLLGIVLVISGRR